MSTTTLEVLFAPAEFESLHHRNLRDTVCVVFDVLRATSSMVTALAHGATAIHPVSEIAEALQLRQCQPDLLLAGERDGVRIEGHLTGGAGFDFGNSPREFTADRILGRTMATTTTNGTRALRACAPAAAVLLGSFLNLRATAAHIQRLAPANLLVVCSGTHDQAAYEDMLGAGALCDSLWQNYADGAISDTAHVARKLYRLEENDLLAGLGQSRNGRRLLTLPALSADVAFCAQRDVFTLVAGMGPDGAVRALPVAGRA